MPLCLTVNDEEEGETWTLKQERHRGTLLQRDKEVLQPSTHDKDLRSPHLLDHIPLYSPLNGGVDVEGLVTCCLCVQGVKDSALGGWFINSQTSPLHASEEDETRRQSFNSP